MAVEQMSSYEESLIKIDSLPAEDQRRIATTLEFVHNQTIPGNEITIGEELEKIRAELKNDEGERQKRRDLADEQVNAEIERTMAMIEAGEIEQYVRSTIVESLDNVYRAVRKSDSEEVTEERTRTLEAFDKESAFRILTLPDARRVMMRNLDWVGEPGSDQLTTDLALQALREDIV